jgi:hypothetical protein
MGDDENDGICSQCGDEPGSPEYPDPDYDDDYLCRDCYRNRLEEKIDELQAEVDRFDAERKKIERAERKEAARKRRNARRRDARKR